ncbi:MAG: methyltransferase small [Marmoricola sp.]|nr:methyltransferase small [Marmoricola sp.]
MTDLHFRLRDALAAAGYTYDVVSDLIGTTAQAALGRNETTPGLRATRGGTPVETLTRMWLLQATVSAEDAERALPGLVDELCAAGILERTLSEVAARVDLRPYGTDGGNLWVASDLTPGLDGGSMRVGSDHVLGISPAATSLAELTVRAPVGRALDLGTGCGVQSLHLATHARHVVATDVNQRALWLTRLNADLNGVSFDVREGSFFEPVAGELFDLIVTNPPFVISPATGERLVYRDSGLPGDRVVEDIVRRIPSFLNPGGVGQVLANWAIEKGTDWDERLAAWLEPATDIRGCDAWIVQREVLDLPSYVELWLKDAGQHGAPDYARRYETWLSWFDDVGVEAVGFGWINLRSRTDDGTDPGPDNHRLEEWRWEVEQPLGPEVAAHFERVTSVRALDDDALLATRPRLAVDVVQETFGPAGAEDPSQIVLRRQRGMRRAVPVDTVTSALAGAADGELTLAQLLAAIGQLLGEVDVAARLAEVRTLIADGFLETGDHLG